MRFKSGDIAYIVENGLYIREVKIRTISGGFATLVFTDREGGTRLRESRLFPTKEAAEATLPKKKTRPHADWS